MSKKIKVGVFFGGISTEHAVSWISAGGIVANLDPEKFAVIQILIDKSGGFWRSGNFFKKGFKKSRLDFNGLARLIDVAFPVLHGQGGEDGAIQGFFETLKIPYVGADVISSAIGLDKSFFNQLMAFNKIPKCKFETIDCLRQTPEEIADKIKNISAEFIFPVFVKAARGGSSIGVIKVKKKNELNKAIQKVKKFDKKIVVEESIENSIEIEVSALGNDIDNYKISFPGRVIPGAEFYDYKDKYFSNKTKFELPADLPKQKVNEIKSLALEVYKIINCTGLARVDFLLDSSLKVFINEINTLPGFTQISMYPKLWETSGLKYKELLTKLIYLALNK